uniref:phosphatidate phosphatase n=1 Tax=Spongospora subterranea TaxID=70186 RepID=A0A0H5RA74_9EUKA|eukprot:CRZ10577.1 hypothetical protein [Spongospora subterranea]
MTSLLKGFVGSLSDALDFNQATLSGSIDIVVIEHNDGSRHSTPFHVRFGKLQLLRSREKLVTISVNGEKTSIFMKLGRAGEAFFYEDTDGHDGDWPSSPTHSALNSPVLSPPQHLVPSDDDLNTKLVIESVINELLDAVVIEMGIQPIISEPEILGLPPLDIGSTQARKASESGNAWSVWSWAWGTFPVRKVSSAAQAMGDDSLLVEVPSPFAASSPTRVASAGSESSGRSLSWVSSIFGLFRGRIDGVNSEYPVLPPLVHVRLFLSRLGNVEVRIDVVPPNPASTSSDQSSSVTGPVAAVPSSPLTSNSPAKVVVLSPLIPPEIPSANSTSERLPRRPASVLLSSEVPRQPSPPLTSLASLEMSLCGHLLVGSCDEDNVRCFKENIISYEMLCADPALVFDPKLVIRYHDMMYPGKTTIPLIMSYLAFGRRISTPADASPATSSPVLSPPKAVVTPAAPRHGFLHRWFGQESVHAFPASVEAIPIVNVPENVPEEPEAQRSRKTLRPTSEMLCSLPLHPGANVISFSVESSLQGTQIVEAYIYLWHESARIVISDVDGTITRSDLLGNIMPLMGKDWSQYGVTSFFSNIAANGYHLLYLTSRAIGQANVTRAYLHSVRQGAVSLPQGPVIMSPDSLMSSFKREVIYRRPQEFKIPALLDVVNLFPTGSSPFVAGFGNRDTDIESYIAVGVPPAMIFIIDPKGAIHRTKNVYRTSYMLLNDQVEHMFPPFHSRRARRASPSFNEFQFWRVPIYQLNESSKAIVISGDDVEKEIDSKKDGDIVSVDHNHTVRRNI